LNGLGTLRSSPGRDQDPGRGFALRVVLVQPRSPGNVGAVARCMANFGFQELRLVTPDRGAILRDQAALRRARWAEPVLDQAQVHETLESALSECCRVYGASSHPWQEGAILDPRQFGDQAAEASKNAPVALVLGREREGLTREEQSLCHAMVRIPTRDGYPDLNLSHAACVLLYEEAIAQERQSPPAAPRPPALPRVEESERFLRDAIEVFLAIDYLKPETARPFLLRLRAFLCHTPITRDELLALQGILHRIRLAMARS